MTDDKPKRNGPCPCGSGKKYKHCCLFFPPEEKAPPTLGISVSEAIKAKDKPR